jgi:hypothetical protein
MAQTSILPTDELDVVLDRFSRFERELLTVPLFDDRPAAEQQRLRREYQEHLEQLDTARAAAANPGAAAAERERMLGDFDMLFHQLAFDHTAWDLAVKVSQIFRRWADERAFWEDMRNNLRPPKPAFRSPLLTDLDELLSRALYRDADARNLLDELRQFLVDHIDAAAMVFRRPSLLRQP